MVDNGIGFHRFWVVARTGLRVAEKARARVKSGKMSLGKPEIRQ